MPQVLSIGLLVALTLVTLILVWRRRENDPDDPDD